MCALFSVFTLTLLTLATSCIICPFRCCHLLYLIIYLIQGHKVIPVMSHKFYSNLRPNFKNLSRGLNLTLSLLGYLKTRLCWGGVNLTPPSKSHVWCPNMTNDPSMESSCALLLESAKKFANLQKLNFLSQNPVIK